MFDLLVAAWSFQPSVTAASLTVTSSSSARSSPWESPSHAGLDSGVVVFDDEFDLIGTRSRSPAVSSQEPPVLPPRGAQNGCFQQAAGM